MSGRKIVVTGGGGFIGGHLAGALLARGHLIRCVDRKPMEERHQIHEGAENVVADLLQLAACMAACEGMDECYQLAADMGAWASSRATRRCACSRSSSIPTCCWRRGSTGSSRSSTPRPPQQRQRDDPAGARVGESSIRLQDGLERTCRWIHDEYMKKYGREAG